MTVIDLPKSEYHRLTKREPILAPRWWIGVLHFAVLYLFGALVHWLLD
jgi:hypothetical protein